MMRPHLRAFMPGTAARIAWKADDRLMAMIGSHFSTGNSSIGETSWMPALLTRMSTLPKVFSARRTIAAISSRLGHVGRRIERLDAEFALDAGALRLDLGRIAEAVAVRLQQHSGLGIHVACRQSLHCRISLGPVYCYRFYD